jgi:hypothetical protein
MSINLFQKEKTGIRIQLKEMPNGKSKSLTIYGADLQTEFNRLFFLYNSLENNEGYVQEIHYENKTIN